MTTIVPSAGQSPDFLQLGPGASASYGAIDLRRAAGAGLQEGVIGTSGGAYKVTLSSGMILTIAASTVDGALVQGDTISAQGLYFVPPHSAAITETVTAAHATLPRIDTVVLEILDANHDGGGSNLARTRIIAGTATSGATLDNRTGAPALPSSAIRLADVLVPAAAASILAANIRDRRPWAAGALYSVTQTTGATYTTATSMALVDTTNLQPRLENSGVPLTLAIMGNLAHNTLGAVPAVSFWRDGAAMFGTSAGELDHYANVAAANYSEVLNLNFPVTPAAGSHLWGVAFGSIGGGTASMFRSTTNPLVFTLREDVRQNANNS